MRGSYNGPLSGGSAGLELSKRDPLEAPPRSGKPCGAVANGAAARTFLAFISHRTRAVAGILMVGGNLLDTHHRAVGPQWVRFVILTPS